LFGFPRKKVISCFDPLADMTIFLNRPTDVAALKSFVDHRVEETRTRRKEILGDTFELYTPHPVTVTTRIIPFLEGNPYKPSFVTVTAWG